MELPRGVTSPPDSEAYYGETDSDADTRSHTHQRRQRRTPPCARCPGRYDNQEEETSEMSGYESATDAGVTMQRNGQGSIGVPRRELIFLPQQTGWTTPAHTPYTLTPHTLTPTPDQGPVDAEGEGDSGFQEAGGYIAPACPPLVSPERAKEALKLSSSNHLVPMVGPLKTPVNEDLSTTYMDKARQAKLQRGESVVEKQVKEARSKCRSIASIAFSHPPSKSSQMPPLMPAVQASPSAPASPSAAQSSLVRPSPAQTFSPSPHPSPAAPAHPSPSACISPSHMSSLNSPPDLTHLAPSATHPILSPSAYIDMTGVVTPTSPPQAPIPDSLTTREQRISVPAARTGILHNAHRCSNKKPMFSALKSKDVSPNPDLMSMVQNMDGGFERAPCVESAAPSAETGHESGPEEDWLRLGAEACNFMQAQQAQRGHRPPPVAPKPQSPQVLQLAGKGGQLFARRQNRMDRYIVERSPSAAAAPYSPAQTREPSPTPSLPATWKYSPNIRAPPPINYNPLLSPSCPLKAQKKPEVKKSKTTAYKGHKADIKPMDIMSHQPYQLNSSLFSYGGGVPQDTSIPNQQRGGPQKTARVCEVKRFSTPPPKATGPTTKVIAPRSATTLGEPLRYSDAMFSSPTTDTTPYHNHHPSPQPYLPQWTSSPMSSPVPPVPTAPLPQLPTFSSPPTFPQSAAASQTNCYFKSAPDLSPLGPSNLPKQGSSTPQPTRVPKPRFSTSNLGLQPGVWRPGSTSH